jgi:hypothetical protein
MTFGWLFLRRGEAADDNSGGLEVGDAMIRAVTHEDCLAEKGNKRARFVVEPAAVGLIEVDDEVVGNIALGAQDRRLQGAVERSDRQFADGVGAGSNGCYGEGHLS